MRYFIIILLAISLQGIGQTLVPGTISTGQSICKTCKPALLTSTPPNGTAPVYQWQSSTGYGWSNIEGATAATYQPDNANATVNYVQIQNASGVTGGPLPTNVIKVFACNLNLIRTLQGIDTYGYLCYNATDTLTVDGSIYPVIVESGGALVLIAGSNVILKPGTSVIAG